MADQPCQAETGADADIISGDQNSHQDKEPVKSSVGTKDSDGIDPDGTKCEDEKKDQEEVVDQKKDDQDHRNDEEVEGEDGVLSKTPVEAADEAAGSRTLGGISERRSDKNQGEVEEKMEDDGGEGEGVAEGTSGQKNDENQEENEEGKEEEMEDGGVGEAAAGEEGSETKTTMTTKEAQFTSEHFKIMLKNLPNRFGHRQLRKMVEGLNLKPKKIKPIERKNYAFITFLCEEDKVKAMEVLGNHTWKGRKLITKLANATEDPMEAHKRKLETQGGEREGQGKRSRTEEKDDENLPLEERLNSAVTPLWRMSYQEQLSMKHRQKKEFLKRLSGNMYGQIPEIRGWVKEQQKKYSGMGCPLEDIKPSPVTNSYRNKCEFTVGTNPDGEEKTVGFRLGLYKGGQISVVNPASCIHIPDQSKAVVQSFQTYIRGTKLSGYDPTTHDGNWRMLTVRTTQGSGVMAVVTLHKQSLSDEEVEKEKRDLAEYFESGDGTTCGVTSMYIHIQRHGDKNAVNYEHIFGDKHITEELLQLKFRISPQAFFQVNTHAAEVLYQTIGEWAGVDKTTTLLDICCGTGTIGISLAKKVEKVIGVEMNQQAVDDAKENATINGVSNVSFHCGKAEDLLPDITNHLHHCLDVVGIVDPPRAGLHQRVVEAVRRCPRLNRLVYVSCDAQQALGNFMNLCRPITKKRKGTPFTLVKAIPVDLFPHTSHCELILLFERNLQSTNAGNDNG